MPDRLSSRIVSENLEPWKINFVMVESGNQDDDQLRNNRALRTTGAGHGAGLTSIWLPIQNSRSQSASQKRTHADPNEKRDQLQMTIILEHKKQ